MSSDASPIDFGALVSPTHIRVRGTVAATAPIESPFSGARAAAFEWKFFVNAHGTFATKAGIAATLLGKYAGVLAPPEARLSLAGTIVHGELELAFDAGVRIAVPPGTIRFLHDAPAPALVECPWPAWLAMPAADDGALYFTEQSLCAGDAVELTATIAPASPGAGIYRGAEARARFVARPDLEPVVIVELAPAPEPKAKR